MLHVRPSGFLVGDIAPREGIPKAEKRRLEEVSHKRLPPAALSYVAAGGYAKLCTRDAA